MESAELDLLFATLAHPDRRRMIDLLIEGPGMSLKALASHFETSRIAVLKHVRALEAAELVLSKKVGRTRHLYFNPVPIQRVHDRWTTRYSAFWSGRLADVKERVEGRAERKTKRA